MSEDAYTGPERRTNGVSYRELMSHIQNLDNHLDTSTDKLEDAMNQMRERHHDAINRVSGFLGRLEIKIDSHIASAGHTDTLMRIGGFESKIEVLRQENLGAARIMQDDIRRLSAKISWILGVGVGIMAVVGVVEPLLFRR